MEAADSLNAKIASSASSPSASADAFETPTDPNVLIYSNAINMVVEMLGTILATQIGSAMATIADPKKEMTAAFAKQHRRPQVYSSSDDTCVVDALAPRSCSRDGAEGKSSLSPAKSRERVHHLPLL